MRYLVAVALALALVAVCVGRAHSNGQNAGDGVLISVAPATIALGGPVDSVTVHTNLPIGTVALDSVALNGAEPTAVWADARGELAARFALADLGEIKPPEVKLTLTGVRDGGSPFEASAIVKVVVCDQR